MPYLTCSDQGWADPFAFFSAQGKERSERTVVLHQAFFHITDEKWAPFSLCPIITPFPPKWIWSVLLSIMFVFNPSNAVYSSWTPTEFKTVLNNNRSNAINQKILPIMLKSGDHKITNLQTAKSSPTSDLTIHEIPCGTWYPRRTANGRENADLEKRKHKKINRCVFFFFKTPPTFA